MATPGLASAQSSPAYQPTSTSRADDSVHVLYGYLLGFTGIASISLSTYIHHSPVFSKIPDCLLLHGRWPRSPLQCRTSRTTGTAAAPPPRYVQYVLGAVYLSTCICSHHTAQRLPCTVWHSMHAYGHAYRVAVAQYTHCGSAPHTLLTHTHTHTHTHRCRSRARGDSCAASCCWTQRLARSP
jgi:hypothetical protein